MIFFLRISRYVGVLFLILILLAAGVLSAARILLPEINRYRAEIVASISASIGKPIELDSMSAGLDGIRPEVVLEGVKIIDPSDHSVVLRFDQLRAGLNLTEYLKTGNFQPRWVTIRGARLSVQRRKDGSISVVGLDSGADMPKWIFEDGQFELLDSELDWKDRKHPGAGLHFSSADIRLLNADRRHRVAIDVDLPSHYGKSLSIRMDFHGDLSLKNCCTGRIYVQARDIQYGRLLEGLSLDGYRVVQGRGAFRLWSDWQNSALVRIAGDVDFEAGRLGHESTHRAPGQALIDLSKIAGGFQWARQGEGWTLTVSRLALNLAGEAWPLTDIGVKRRVDSARGISDLYFSSSYLKLDELGSLLIDLRALAPDLQRTLLHSAPDGEIFDLKLGYSSRPNQGLQWFVCGRFEDIRFRPWQVYPGVENLSGYLCGDRDDGRIEVRAPQAEIDLPKVFRNPLEFTTLEGEFLWHRDHRSVSITGSKIKAVNSALAVESRMLLRIPLADGGLFLDFQAEFENVDAVAAHRYLPVNVLKKPLIEWLDSAFVSGKVSHGEAIFRGPVNAFPFHGGEGVFEALFHTEDVVLSYHPDWPVITTDVAEVRFFQAGMSIHGDKARISGTRVEDVRVRSDNFEFDDYLTITGSAAGTLDESIKFLKKSPLGPLYRPLLEYVSIHGDNRIGLELKVPVGEQVDDILVNGTIALKQASLEVFGMEMDRIHGNLKFSRDTIRGVGIRGEFLDSPIRVEISDNRRGLAVQINGSVELESLADRFPSRFWTFTTGKSDYSMEVQIPKLDQKLFAEIDLYSDLRGTAILLPEPLTKQADVARRFSLKAHLEPGQAIPVQVMYGGIAQAQLRLSQKSEGVDLEKGIFELGHREESKTADRGLSLVAGLDRFDFSPWKDFLTSLNPDGVPGTTALNLVDIRIGELKMDELDLGPFSVKMERRNGVWQGFTESNLASGQFTGQTRDPEIPGLNLAFEYLRIPEQENLLETVPKKKAHFDPGSIVDLNIRAEHFYWKDLDYGTLELATRRQPHGMKIDRLNLRGNGLNLNLSGFWTASGSNDRTFITGNMTIDNLGHFLNQLGKSNVIKDSNVSSSIMLTWRDPLFDLDVKTLSGNVRIEFGSGRLLTVEPGIGRLFGLFNLDGLRNLLLFDFGKLFGQGLAFEGVESAFLLTDGRATIKRLIIDAVPAEIRVSGEIDLVQERFEDIVTVVPKGVVAAGASMLLTQELPGSAVDGLINRQYQVTGKWDNPEIVRLPGTGKPL